jgi:hypothetical protein
LLERAHKIQKRNHSTETMEMERVGMWHEMGWPDKAKKAKANSNFGCELWRKLFFLNLCESIETLDWIKIPLWEFVFAIQVKSNDKNLCQNLVSLES